jgi:hypothetical protein
VLNGYEVDALGLAAVDREEVNLALIVPFGVLGIRVMRVTARGLERYGADDLGRAVSKTGNADIAYDVGAPE